MSDNAQSEADARRALKQCREACLVLHERLLAEGYPKVPGVIDPDQSDLLAEVIDKLHPPRILQLFWEIVGGIEFVDFKNYAHVKYFKNMGITAMSDPVEIIGGIEGLKYQLNEYENYCISKRVGDIAFDEPFYFQLAADAYHKDDISGGDYGILLGDEEWLPTFQGFKWIGSRKPAMSAEKPDFMTYLRASLLECGGFPGLYGVDAFELLRLRLVRGLPDF